MLDIYASHYVVEANHLCTTQVPTTNVVFALENSRAISLSNFYNMKGRWSDWIETSIGSQNKVGNLFFCPNFIVFWYKSFVKPRGFVEIFLKKFPQKMEQVQGGINRNNTHASNFVQWGHVW